MSDDRSRRTSRRDKSERWTHLPATIFFGVLNVVAIIAFIGWALAEYLP